MSPELPNNLLPNYRPDNKVLELLARVGGRQEIVDIYPSLAEIYASLFRIANDQENKDRFSLVAHSIRELMSLAVRDRTGKDGRTSLQAVRDAISSLGWSQRTLKQKTAQELIEIIEKVLGGKSLREKLMTIFNFSESLAGAWVEFYNEVLFGYVHHGDGAPPTEEDMRTIIERANSVLLQAFGRIVEHTHAIDRLIALGPPKEMDFGKVKAELKYILASPALSGYFLGKLQDTAWVPLIRRAGFFKPVTRSENEGKVLSDLWPAWRFLARIAETGDAYQLAQIIKESKMLLSPAVISECLNVLIKISPEQSASCAKTLASWLASNREPAWLAKEVGDLLKKWVGAGQKNALFMVLAVILKPHSSPDKFFGSIPKIEGAFSGFWFGQLLAGVLPSVQTRWPNELMDLLEEKLRKVSKLLGKQNTPKGAAFPSFWRSAIEDSDQDPGRDELADQLVPALRKTLESSLPSAPKEVLARCKKYVWGDFAGHTIFVRLALYIAGKADEKTWDDFHRKVMKDSRFVADDTWYRQTYHEMYHFLQQVFPSLPLKDRDMILKRLESSLRKIKDAQKRTWPEQRWLHAVAEGLSDLPRWKARLAELTQKRPLGEKPDFMIHIGESQTINMASELKPEALRDMDDVSILHLIQNPPSIKDDFFDDPDHRRRTLGKDIQEAVKIDPARFINLGNALLRLDESWPTHYWVEGYLAAFGNLNWNLLDQLIRWGWELVKKQEPAPPDVRQDRDLDVFYWAGAYCVFLRLLDQIVKSAGNDLTDERLAQIRDLIIALIKVGTADRDPNWTKTPSRRVLLDYDPMHDAFNTAAGVGVQTLMHYVIVRMGKKYPGQKSPYPPDAIEPEALAILETILNDPRPYMRCVIGSSFKNLFALKPEWTREHINQIFPNENRELWLGSMAGFLTRSQPVGGCVEELKPHYALAVDILSSLKQGKDRLHGDPFDGLARHLMISYLWGCLGLEAEGILQKFFQTTPLEYREEAISFLGGVLQGQGDLVKKNIDWWPRMKALWSERIAQIKISTSQPNDLRAFSRWLKGLPESFEAIFPLLIDTVPSFDNWHMRELLEYLEEQAKSSGRYCLSVLKSLATANPYFPVAGASWHDAELFAVLNRLANQDSLRASNDFKEIVEKIVKIKSESSDVSGVVRYRQLLDTPS